VWKLPMLPCRASQMGTVAKRVRASVARAYANIGHQHGRRATTYWARLRRFTRAASQAGAEGVAELVGPAPSSNGHSADGAARHADRL